MLAQLRVHGLGSDAVHFHSRFKFGHVSAIRIGRALVNEAADRVTRGVRAERAARLLTGFALDDEYLVRVSVNEHELSRVAAFDDVGFSQVLTIVVAHEVGCRSAAEQEFLVDHVVLDQHVRHAERQRRIGAGLHGHPFIAFGGGDVVEVRDVHELHAALAGVDQHVGGFAGACEADGVRAPDDDFRIGDVEQVLVVRCRAALLDDAGVDEAHVHRWQLEARRVRGVHKAVCQVVIGGAVGAGKAAPERSDQDGMLAIFGDELFHLVSDFGDGLIP